MESLCIVQDDDEEEKGRDMGKTWQVYAGATLTISASRVSHCDEGFLQQRELRWLYGEVYKLPWRENTSNTSSSAREKGDNVVYCSDTEFYRSEADPIDTRAWTMQEHELPHRLLRFSAGQLVWKYPAGADVDGGFADERSPEHVSYGRDKLLKDWREVVKKYTARHTSNPKDRLPAIAAMAEDFAWLLRYDTRVTYGVCACRCCCCGLSHPVRRERCHAFAFRQPSESIMP